MVRRNPFSNSFDEESLQELRCFEDSIQPTYQAPPKEAKLQCRYFRKILLKNNSEEQALTISIVDNKALEPVADT